MAATFEPVAEPAKRILKRGRPKRELEAQVPTFQDDGSFKPEFLDQAKTLAHLGATDAEIADFFGIDRIKFYQWRHTRPDFRQAVMHGREGPDDRVERSLFEMAGGYDYMEQEAIKVRVSKDREEVQVVDVRRHQPADKVAAIHWLKQRRKEQWGDNVDLGRQRLEGMSTAELEKMLADGLKSLGYPVAKVVEGS